MQNLTIKKNYTPPDNFLNDEEAFGPENISILLSEIICRSERKSLDPTQSRCSVIALSTKGATRLLFHHCYLALILFNLKSMALHH